MKRLLLMSAAATLLAVAQAGAQAADPLDPLHSVVCTGAGTGCATTDNNTFAPLSQMNNWGFQISPGPATGDLTLGIFVPTNQINVATFTLPGLTDNGGSPLLNVIKLAALLNVLDGASIATYLGLPNAGDFSPTDNFANLSAGEAIENPLFGGNFLSFKVTLTGLHIDANGVTTLANDFSFGDNLPAGTVIVGFLNMTTDSKGDPCTDPSKCSIGTAASNDLVVTPQLTAVPAPIVGAGLPGLMVALGGLLALNRRRRQAQGLHLPA